MNITKYVYIFGSISYEYGKEGEISRRDFITILWGAVTALPFLYGALRFLSPPAKKFRSSLQKNRTGSNLQAVLDLNTIPEDSSKLINIDVEPVILIRRKGNDFSALSAECTHLNCIVGYRKNENDIYCSCHGGTFDTSGNVIGGPPKSPLKKYEVTVNANKIIIKKPV